MIQVIYLSKDSISKCFAAAYIRVSTDNQTELSPSSQLKIIKKFADEKGYLIDENFIFRDNGISGRYADKRPEFNRMITLSKQKPPPFSAVLVWKFSRFARNQEESIFYKSLLRKNGIEVISVSEPVDDGPFGKLIERIIEWSDEYYSIRLSGEVRRGMTEKAERGGVVSIAPFGYKVTDNKLIVNDEQAEIVRKIFDDFLNSKNIKMICDNLNSAKIKTAKGNIWDCRAVEYILQNPVYIGKIRWNPNGKTGRNFSNSNLLISDGQHKPIIEENTFRQVQQILFLQKIIKGRYSHQNAEIKFLFQNIVKCSNCKANLVPIINTALQCSAYIHGKCHSSHYVNVNKLEKAIIKAVNILFENNYIKYPFLNDQTLNLKIKNNLLSLIIKSITFDRKSSHFDILLSGFE